MFTFHRYQRQTPTIYHCSHHVNMQTLPQTHILMLILVLWQPTRSIYICQAQKYHLKSSFFIRTRQVLSSLLDHMKHGKRRSRHTYLHKSSPVQKAYKLRTALHSKVQHKDISQFRGFGGTALCTTGAGHTSKNPPLKQALLRKWAVAQNAKDCEVNNKICFEQPF